MKKSINPFCPKPLQKFLYSNKAISNQAVRQGLGILFLVAGYSLLLGLVFGLVLILVDLPNKQSHTLNILYLVIFLIIAYFAYWITLIGHRMIKVNALNIILHKRGNYILYLRSFEDENMNIERRKFESMIVSICGKIGPVVAVTNPNTSDPPPRLGANRLTLNSNDWQSEVKKIIEHSKFVFVILGKTAGLMWEIEQILETAPDKLNLVIPPLEDNVVAQRLSAFKSIASSYGITMEDPPKHARLLYITNKIINYCWDFGWSIRAYTRVFEQVHPVDAFHNVNVDNSLLKNAFISNNYEYQNIWIENETICLVKTTDTRTECIPKNIIQKVSFIREIEDNKKDPWLHGITIKEYWLIHTKNGAHPPIGANIVTKDFLLNELGPLLGSDITSHLEDITNHTHLCHIDL